MRKSDLQLVEEALNHYHKLMIEHIEHYEDKILTIRELLSRPSALSSTIKIWWDKKET